jgi:hypothetical protein
MTALSFNMLDRHVVDGRSEQVACTDATGSLTFARLLERSAALAGGLVVLGLRPGDGVKFDLPGGNERVIAVCALIRLGAVPATGAETRITAVEGVGSVRINDNDIAAPWVPGVTGRIRTSAGTTLVPRRAGPLKVWAVIGGEKTNVLTLRVFSRRGC